MNLNFELLSFTQKNVLAYVTKFYLSNKLVNGIRSPYQILCHF